MFFCNSEQPLIWGIVTGTVRVRECGVHLGAAPQAEKGNKKGIKAEREMTIVLEMARWQHAQVTSACQTQGTAFV